MRLNLFVALFVFIQGVAFSNEFSSKKLTVHSLTGKPQQLIIHFPQDTLSVYSEFKLVVDNVPLDNAKFSYLSIWPKYDSQDKAFIRTMVISNLDRNINHKSLHFQYKAADKAIDKYQQNKSEIALAWIDFEHVKSSLFLTKYPLNNNADWYTEPFKKYAHFLTDKKGMNEAGFSDAVARQWLYDRAQSLYSLWTFTNENQWLNEAKKVTDFYIENIDEKGRFLDKGRMDIKYLMPRSILYSYLLSGDERYKLALEKQFRLSLQWNGQYTSRTGFWTERNFASVFNAALSYWEIDQSVEAAERINQLLNYGTSMVVEPANQWQSKSCLQHSYRSHEGSGGNNPVCSPWMSALLVDSLWRYYVLSGNDKAALLIEGFGDFVLNHGIYFDNKHFPNKPIPKYLAVLGNSRQESRDAWSDRYHACDVAALVGRAAFIKDQKGKDSFLLSTLMTSLVDLCNRSHPANYQQKAKLRIMPPRKFNWMYGTTVDLPWLVEYFKR